MTEPEFVAVRSVGALLPADLLSRLAAGQIPGLRPADYHLPGRESVREAANRAWSYLTGVWAAYQAQLGGLPEADRATSLTRERWLLPLLRELGFGRPAATGAGGIPVGGRSRPVSYRWEHVPIHLLGWRVELDRRSQRVAGAAAAQALVQDCLNRSEEHLWGVLSNGRMLRVLRDSTSLVGSAYVEFDLSAIFDGQLFSDFVLLFVLCHQSRFERLTPDVGPAECWLERWRAEAIETGRRARSALRDGVVDALERLGTGFLQHPANGRLRADLAAGRLAPRDYHHALLRTAYQLLFLFVAEDRRVLLDPAAPPAARRRYAEFFSTARLRRLAARRRGGRTSTIGGP